MERQETAIHAIVSGRVQGVGFRAWTVAQARRLGVSGRVRNCASGEVEILAEGRPETLRDFLAIVEKGPPGARVERVSVNPAVWRGLSGFTVEF